MRRLIGITALLALLSACSDKKGSLSGDWRMESITVNGKQQPLDDCTKKTYLNFGKDSITYHTFMPQADCKETVFHLAYKATKDSLKVTNETGRIERSYYAVRYPNHHRYSGDGRTEVHFKPYPDKEKIIPNKGLPENTLGSPFIWHNFCSFPLYENIFIFILCLFYPAIWAT